MDLLSSYSGYYAALLKYYATRVWKQNSSIIYIDSSLKRSFKLVPIGLVFNVTHSWGTQPIPDGHPIFRA